MNSWACRSCREFGSCSRVLGTALADVTCHPRKIVRRRTGDLISVLDGHPEEPRRLGPCSFDAQQRRIGELALRDVLHRGLAELLGARLEVEQVVDYLESQAGGVAVGLERGELRVAGVGEEAAEKDGRRQQLAGL